MTASIKGYNIILCLLYSFFTRIISQKYGQSHDKNYLTSKCFLINNNNPTYSLISTENLIYFLGINIIGMGHVT